MNNKVCTKCEGEKPVEEFGTRKSQKGDGSIIIKPWCKTCENESIKIWRNANPEIYKKQQLKHGKDRITRAQADPEYRKLLNAQKMASTRKDVTAYIVRAARGRAKRRGIPFTITIEDITIPTHCPLLGIELKLGTKGNYFHSPSLDRIDNNLGYVPGNVAIISCKANSMKNSATKEEMTSFIKNVQAYMQIKI